MENRGRKLAFHRKRNTGWIGFDKKGWIQFTSCNLKQFLDWEGETTHKVHDFFQGYDDILEKLNDCKVGIHLDTIIERQGKYIYVLITDDYPLEGDSDVFLMLTDVSTDVALRAALAGELENTQKINENNERFSYIVSHDLMEPIRTIGNFTQLLEYELEGTLTEDAKTYIDFVTSNVKILQKMINDLLSYNRSARAKLVYRELLIADLIHLQEYQLKDLIAAKNATIKLNTEEAKVVGDAKWIGVVFYHFIKNAMMYNSSDKVEIEVVVESSEDEFITVKFKDNGVGLSKEEQENVFQLLGRVGKRPDAEGTGVGLAVCKTIIDMHGGEIGYESDENQGTVFYFKIPALPVTKDRELS